MKYKSTKVTIDCDNNRDLNLGFFISFIEYKYNVKFESKKSSTDYFNSIKKLNLDHIELAELNHLAGLYKEYDIPKEEEFNKGVFLFDVYIT